MPRISFTGEEHARINHVLRELDPATHDLTAHWRNLLSGEDWAFLQDYVRTEMRATLEMGMLARSIAAVVDERRLADKAAVDHFMRSTPWSRNFGLTDEAEERLMSILGQALDSPLFLAIEALMQMAEDRMFDTLDIEYRSLLEGRL